jgi:hypothetical protein
MRLSANGSPRSFSTTSRIVSVSSGKPFELWGLLVGLWRPEDAAPELAGLLRRDEMAPGIGGVWRPEETAPELAGLLRRDEMAPGIGGVWRPDDTAPELAGLLRPEETPGLESAAAL